MKTSIRLATLLLFLFAAGACDDDDNGIIDPTPDPEADAGADQTVAVGETVTLDGSASTAPAGQTLSYSWALTDQPEGSEATLTGETTVSPTFVPDLEGTYTAQLTVTADGDTDTDEVTITAAEGGAGNEISADITEDTTLDDTETPYTVTGEISVSAALTIAPGVVLNFTEDSRMIVAEEGSLNAVGTEEEMIQFLGETEEAGHWQGIEFQSDSEENVLDFVEVGYGGGGDFHNVLLSDDSSATITNSFIHDSAGWGIFVSDGAASWTIEDNTYEENAEGDVREPAA